MTLLLHVLYNFVDIDCVHEVDGLGRNALMYAVHFGHLDTMQILIEQGIDINSTAHGQYSSHISLLVISYEASLE